MRTLCASPAWAAGLLALASWSGLSARTGAAEIIFRQDFEDRAALKKWAGTFVTDKTFNGSKGAMKSLKLEKNKWFGAKIEYQEWKQTSFKITDKTYLSLCYFVSERAPIKFQFSTGDKDVGNIALSIEKPTAGEWVVFTTPLTDFKDKAGTGKKVQPGLPVKSMNFLYGRPGSDAVLHLDNVVISTGAIPKDLDAFIKKKKREAAARARRLEAERAAQTLTLAHDQAAFSPAVVQNLKRSWKKDARKAKTILNVGGRAAKSLGHWTPLTRKELAGYTLLPKFHAARPNTPLAQLTPRVEKALEKLKPEVVTILIGNADLARRRSVPEITSDISTLLATVSDAGAVPILYTLALPAAGPPPVLRAYKELSAGLRKLAARRQVPLIDAFAILNPHGIPNPKFFSGSSLSSRGQRALNAASLKVYRKLEEWVFERREKTLARRRIAEADALPGITDMGKKPLARKPGSKKPRTPLEEEEEE